MFLKKGMVIKMKVEKTIKISLQNATEVKEAILYNEENNYEYILVYEDYNLIDSRLLETLILAGYDFVFHNTMGMGDYSIMKFYHKNYKEE